jgi:phospholipase C
VTKRGIVGPQQCGALFLAELVLAAALVILLTNTLTEPGGQSHPEGAPQAGVPIEKVVVIVKEPRTFDDMFGRSMKARTTPAYAAYAKHFALAEGMFSSETQKICEDREAVCFNEAFFEELDAEGVTWRYYVGRDQLHNVSRAIRQIRSLLRKRGVVAPSRFLADAQSGDLQQISFVIAPMQFSEPLGDDHTNVCVGENWTVRHLNILMRSGDWDEITIFVVWDDIAGLYEHLAPVRADDSGWGPRAMLVISPWAKRGYVSRTDYEYSSLPEFIERVYSLPAVDGRTALVKDLFDVFHFSVESRPPLFLEPRSEVAGAHPAECA